MNAWVVDADGRLVTRSLSHDILPGVTRRVILDAAAEALNSGHRTVVHAEGHVDGARGLRVRRNRRSAGGRPGRDSRSGDGKPGPVTRRVQELYGRLAEKRALERF